MIVRIGITVTNTADNPIVVPLPTWSLLAADLVTARAMVNVPDIDVPADVAAFVTANPVVDLTSPLPNAFPASLARSWQEHLARRYDLGTAKWKPTVA